MIKIFVSYAKEDVEKVSSIVKHLEQVGYSVWIDYKDLLPGQNWEEEIKLAIENSNFVLACLSKNSVSKKGHVQKEIKTAFNIFEQLPDGEIYLIPIRLDECELPMKFKSIHYLDLFNDDSLVKLSNAIMLSSYSKEKKLTTQQITSSKLRLLRLLSDAKSVFELTTSNQFIEILDAIGEPPYKYLLKYLVTGVSEVREGTIITKNEHIVEVILKEHYPLQDLPCVNFKTKIFHPNVWENGMVCLGFYDISESLGSILVRIAKMIDYEIFNSHSPSNHEAAKWSEREANNLPLQKLKINKTKKYAASTSITRCWC